MRTISRILCALDLSEQSKQVADYSSTLAGKFGAELYAINVTPMLTQYMGVNVSIKSINKLSGELFDNAEQQLNEFIAEHFQGIPVTGHVQSGHPADEILAFALTCKADLIIMGTHGHQGINRILFGSVAEGVVKNSPVPVITIRPSLSN